MYSVTEHTIFGTLYLKYVEEKNKTIMVGKNFIKTTSGTVNGSPSTNVEFEKNYSLVLKELKDLGC